MSLILAGVQAPAAAPKPAAPTKRAAPTTGPAGGTKTTAPTKRAPPTTGPAKTAPEDQSAQEKGEPEYRRTDDGAFLPVFDTR